MMLNKLSLNTIGLNRIGLNRIGKPSRGSSDRPYIDSEVLASLKAVCICYGKSNDDPDRAVVKNLVDPDNPFVISNAAFKLNSGFGKYGISLTDSITPARGAKVTDNSILVVDDTFIPSWIYYSRIEGAIINSYSIKISGMPENKLIQYWYNNEEGIASRFDIRTDGVYTLPQSYAPADTGSNKTIGLRIFGDLSQKFVGLKVEIIPSFEGAFVTDGVDDLITSTKSTTEMLDGSNEVTVVSMMCQIGDTKDPLNRNNWLFASTSYLESRVEKEKTGKTGIYGYTSTNINNGQISNINTILGDKNDYIVSSKIESTGLDHFTVEGFQKGGIWYTSSIAWYWTIIANKVLTTDQINQVIAYYNLDRCVEPTVWYDVQKQGLSNDTPDSDWYLKDYSGNGYDMTLYNYAKTPESGINEDGGLQSDGVNDYGKVTGLPIYKDYTVAIDYQRLDKNIATNIGSSSVLSKSSIVGQGAFLSNQWNNIGTINHCYSFGKDNIVAVDDSERKIYYQSKYSNQGISINAGSGTDGSNMWLGTIRDNDSRFFNGAIYSLMSFPYSMSEFLIERQLKKYKLGTLYPNMVEFRPIIKHDDRITAIKYYHIKESSWVNLKPGDYIPVGSKISITTNLKSPYTIANVVSSSLTDIKVVPSAGGGNAYDILGYVTDKSPQKIAMDIQVDSSLVLFNPTINSNAIFEVGNEQNMTELFTQLNNGEIDGIILYMQGDKAVLPNNWIDKNTKVRAIIYCLDTVSEEDIHFTVDGKTKYCYSAIEDGLAAFGIMDEDSQEEQYMTNVLTANTIDIQLDQYIRYEDIVQPYPVLLRFNDENGNEVSWGGKFRVGSTITRIGSISDPESNLLNGLYSVSGLSLNGKAVTSSTSIVEKQMVFRTTATWLLDNNEPKVILSPSRLRIPNSSYKLLGYIPDISGHGNHGILHNSDYAEGSGVNEDGSYQLDGVNDHVTIPTVIGGGKQVLMKVNNNTINSMLYDQRSSGASPNSLYNDFAIYCTNTADNNLIAYQARLVGNTYIDGILNTNITCEDLLGVLHNITITCDIVAPNNGVVPNIGRGGVLKDLYSNMALYDFMLFDNISTDDKIKELNEYVGIEAKVELPPYYWDDYNTLAIASPTIEGNINTYVTLPYKTEQEIADLNAVDTYYSIYFIPIDLDINEEVTIEMLPLYPNGLVYDGITDYSKNANIPALDDFTAIIKREFLKKQGSPLIKGSKVYEGGNGNALLLEWDKAYNFVFYKRTDIMEGELPDNISFITPTNYNGNVITRGSEQDTNGICIAGDGNAGFANMVFYKLILYPKTIPLLQINFLKNLMERDEIIDLNNKIFIQE